jgi:hypothetical protein
LASLQQAIELYYEKKGSYPRSDGWISTVDLPGNREALAEALIPEGLIGKIPCDPKSTGCATGGTNSYMYYRDDTCGGSPTKYSLYAKLENPSSDERASMHESYARCNQAGQDPKRYHMNYRLGN